MQSSHFISHAITISYLPYKEKIYTHEMCKYSNVLTKRRLTLRADRLHSLQHPYLTHHASCTERKKKNIQIL